MYYISGLSRLANCGDKVYLSYPKNYRKLDIVYTAKIIAYFN